jgi:hypothetical protein
LNSPPPLLSFILPAPHRFHHIFLI